MFLHLRPALTCTSSRERGRFVLLYRHTYKKTEFRTRSVSIKVPAVALTCNRFDQSWETASTRERINPAIPAASTKFAVVNHSGIIVTPFLRPHSTTGPREVQGRNRTARKPGGGGWCVGRGVRGKCISMRQSSPELRTSPSLPERNGPINLAQGGMWCYSQHTPRTD